MNSFKRYLMIAAAVALSFVLSACSKAPEPQKVSFQTLEDARAQATQNAKVNAIAYVRENPRMQGMDVVTHGDSTQTAECPQGDGWASLSVMRADQEHKDERGRPTIEKYKIKCSTVSANIGCFIEEDFKKKQYAQQEDHCDPNLPFPLPKVIGKG